MLISFVLEVSVQGENIIHQMKLEFLDILSVSLAFNKSFPCFEKVLERCDMLIDMNTPIKPPPRMF